MLWLELAGLFKKLYDLVEIEGSPAEIERAILATGLPRDGFSTDRLPDFALRYKARTGVPAATLERSCDTR